MAVFTVSKFLSGDRKVKVDPKMRGFSSPTPPSGVSCIIKRKAVAREALKREAWKYFILGRHLLILLGWFSFLVSFYQLLPAVGHMPSTLGRTLLKDKARVR